MSLPSPNSTVKEFKEYLKDIGSTYSFKTRNEYLQRIAEYQKAFDFPWRDDQRECLQYFLTLPRDVKIFVISAIFGSGKTTLLMGMLLQGILKKSFLPSEVFFISFNISIRNEIKKKIKNYGFKNITIRTYDSIIYELCKLNGYPHMELPNFEGKRKYIRDIQDLETTGMKQPRIIFIDECQDLELDCMNILEKVYPNTLFVLSGDVFQSIQKEPRESMLWKFIHTSRTDVKKYFMNITPRVPKNVLVSIKKALTDYYPEFSQQISNWKSSNTHSNASIEWKKMYNYTNIYTEIDEFLRTHPKKDTMILTFSSAITVRGAMGDVARLRGHLFKQKIEVNRNHKRMDDDTCFLTTANSSKGLERDYVICFLTFPLEKAFVNFSDDITINLITVALTRAKKKVVFYVPNYEDKYSRVLSFFEECPKPVSKRIREDDKPLDSFTHNDYINMEHCVTTLLRQGIIKYDTRIKLRENFKLFKREKIFTEENSHIRDVPKMFTEEEKSFVGICIENLLTSSWKGEYPLLYQSESISANPMYQHCIKRIEKLIKKYNKFIKTNPIGNIDNQYQGIYLYSQLHVAVNDKIFIDLSPTTYEHLKRYWSFLQPKANLLKPEGNKLTIQSRCKMPLVTGVADAISEVDKQTFIVEIKAMTDASMFIKQERKEETKKDNNLETLGWKDDASIQAIIYSLMNGKNWSRIHLLNPFVNQRVCYHFNSKNINTLRNYVLTDILIYNINSMLAKMKKVVDNREEMEVSDNLFVYVNKKDDTILQASVIRMETPIKCEVLYNEYSYEEVEKSKYNRLQKLRKESKKTSEEISKDIEEIIRDKKVKDFSSRKRDEDVFKDYVCKEDFSLDNTDTLHNLFMLITVLSKEFKFI